MFKYYSQLDPLWATDTIGGTRLTIGRWGCCLTSMCMVVSKSGGNVSPKEAAKRWRYTTDGLLVWKTDFPGLEFVSRSGYVAGTLQKWLQGGNYAVIQVDGFHWLMADKWGLFGLQAIDPLGGHAVNPLKKYRNITGVAYFRKAAGKATHDLPA
jgi:hypothetical protein